jgi:hypothetical protein
VTVDGKIYRESLETTVYSVAKQKFPDYVKDKVRKKRQIGAPVIAIRLSETGIRSFSHCESEGEIQAGPIPTSACKQ